MVFTSISQLLCRYNFSVFVPPYTISVRHRWVERMCSAIKEGGRMWGWAIKRNNFAWVGPKIFWRVIYFANRNPETDSHYVSLSQKILGKWYPWIIREYYLATAIVIRPLTHPRTCKMGSSIFAAMSQLKFASMNWYSLPKIPLTERKMENFFPLFITLPTVLFFLMFLPC